MNTTITNINLSDYAEQVAKTIVYINKREQGIKKVHFSRHPYFVSGVGNVYSLSKNKKELNLMTAGFRSDDEDEYKRVQLSNIILPDGTKGKPKNVDIHRLVAFYFANPLNFNSDYFFFDEENCLEVHHIDKNTLNNHWTNLFIEVDKDHRFIHTELDKGNVTIEDTKNICTTRFSKLEKFTEKRYV